MKLVYLLPAFLAISLITTIPSQSATFYVKPTPNTTCPGQPCETLQYYLDSRVYTQKCIQNLNLITSDVTMIFMSGVHTINGTSTNRVNIGFSICISSSSVNLMGQERNNVKIQCLVKICNFAIILEGSYNIAKMAMNYIGLDGIYSRILQLDTRATAVSMTSVQLLDWSMIGISRVETVTIKHSTVYGSMISVTGGMTLLMLNSKFSSQSYAAVSALTRAILQDCSFHHSQLITMNAHIVLEHNNTFTNTSGSAVKCYQSDITVNGKALFQNNEGTRGGALALYSSTLHLGAGVNVTFANNSADKGGAIYIEPNLSPFVYFIVWIFKPKCFIKLNGCNSIFAEHYNVNFINNSAQFGGDDIYGASFNSKYCQNDEYQSLNCNVTVTGASSNISSVSSDPTRVCLCDSQGQPLCNATNMIHRTVSSGEMLAVKVVPVGENFGTTSGGVMAYFSKVERMTSFKPGNIVPIQSKFCTEVNYSFFSNYTHANAILALAALYSNPNFSVTTDINVIPVKVNVILVPCPPGFQLTRDPLFPACTCYHHPCNIDVQCTIVKGSGQFSWNGSLWIGVGKEEKIVCNRYCPIDYCNTSIAEWIDVHGNPDSQCGYNRAGRLCGGCRENYSLAIGSSHCIHCPNSHNLALIIFFAVAGFLLVLLITAMNLTVTQNAVNELVFYANIVWIYQNIFFPSGQQTSSFMVFLKTFIAWINLDFGIETCFVRGLTAFWKTWLQFVFPFYIWSLVGLIIVAARHSTRFTRLLPSRRTIPVLCTAFLLSYMKLVGITSSALKFSFISEYPNDTLENPNPLISTVWSIDGNLSYGGYPHIFLFLAGLVTLLFLWLPYTLLLLLMQWLRRLSHLKFLKWIQQLFPISDAYFAPLNHNHQYWFGVLLLARGVLFVTSTSAFGISNAINLLILLVSLVVLLMYMNLMQVYSTTAMLVFNNTFKLNLIVLSAYFLLTYTQPDWKNSEVTAIAISIGFVFLQFCGIVVYALIMECRLRGCSLKRRQACENHQLNQPFINNN